MDDGDPGGLAVRVYWSPHPPDLQDRLRAFLGALTDEDRRFFSPPESHILHAAAIVALEGPGEAIQAIAGHQEGETRAVLFLAVLGHLRGLGWGRHLAEIALLLIPDGLAQTLTVDPDNLGAIRIYEKLGFRETCRVVHMERPGPDQAPIKQS